MSCIREIRRRLQEPFLDAPPEERRSDPVFDEARVAGAPKRPDDALSSSATPRRVNARARNAGLASINDGFHLVAR